MGKFLIGILLLTLSVSGCYHKADPQNSDIAGIIPLQEDDKGVYAMEARYFSWPNPDTLIIYIDGTKYKVAASGDIFSPKGEKKYSINNDYPIEQLYFAQRGRNLFLFYTDVAENGAGSFVKRLSLDTGEIIWETEIEGFSFSKPLIKGQFAYIGTIGFIGKMKLKNGAFDWKYSGLGQKGRFSQFRDIDFKSSREVRFVAPHPFSLQSDTVIVNDITGEITLMNW
ncbi:MAG: hypothetical protein J6Y82_10055 [Bacteroidales bacterium]|nr:hypothetical protein [Bacteroidales bacterium]